MHFDFWKERWDTNEIGFHESEANPALVDHFEKLGLADQSRVFVPLCGKTLDMAWLLSQGCRVVGAEWSKQAVEELFVELGFDPRITEAGGLSCYSVPKFDVFVGDVFDLDQTLLGPIDAIYDRAALVALPEETRSRYTDHLLKIGGDCDQLLVTFEYDQSLCAGPPFSVDHDELQRHYSKTHEISLLQSKALPAGLKGKYDAVEKVWLLKD